MTAPRFRSAIRLIAIGAFLSGLDGPAPAGQEAGRAEPSPTADSGKPASRAGSGASSRWSAPADELDDEDAPF